MGTIGGWWQKRPRSLVWYPNDHASEDRLSGMVRRSLMFTPADRPEMMQKAPSAGADVIVFDLEDAVAPDRKAEARKTVRSVLSDPDFSPTCEVCVRVNPPGIDAAADLYEILQGSHPDSIMLPKATRASDVDTLDRLLKENDASMPILPIIESASGVVGAVEIGEHPRTDALIFGAEDLAADLGATRTEEGTEVLYARQRVVIAATAVGVDAIDTVYTDFRDIEGLRADAEQAVRFGYDGKLAIHPAQVEPINDAFTPSLSEIEWAIRVLDAQEDAAADNRGVFSVDGEMIDAPLIAQAERFVRRARAAGVIEPETRDGE